MMKFEFDGQTINVPTSWRDITLGDYEKWYGRKTENKLDYLYLIAHICHVSTDWLLNLPAEQFEHIGKEMQFVFDTDFAPHYMVEIDQQKYFVSSSNDLTLGEWVDADSVLQSEQTDQQLSNLLAIVCRPVAEKYDTKLSEQRAQLFRSQPCDKMLPLISFFLLREKQLDKTLAHCLQVAAQADQFLKDTKTFVANGDGTKRLPIWQRIRYYFLIRLLEKRLSKFSDLCSI